MYSTLDLQKLIQMLAFLGISTNGNVAIGGGAVRPASPQLYQLWWDTSLGGPGQLICCTQISPSIVWCDAAGVPV